ncbi:MAG TPA: discoidin domain-containing protein [Polyangiaceae bacterium]
MGSWTKALLLCRVAGLLAVLAVLVTLGCGKRVPGVGAGDAANLLAGLKAQKSRHVRCTACLTDGIAAPDGGYWKTEGTAVFERAEGFVEYDLGSVRRIRAAWAQGDNNDSYQIAGSTDGAVYTTLWIAEPVSRPGLQGRARTRLDARARYVRLTASGGDGNYSLTEVQLFAESPKTLPAPVHTVSGIAKNVEVRTHILGFGLALIGLVALAYRKAPFWWLGLSFVPALAAGYALVSILLETWPQEQREVSLVRGTIAVVAGAALLRELWAPARFPARRGVVLGVLGFCGVVGFLAFYNLGVPQFRDHELGKSTYVHQLDLRQYYPTAKYFPEVGYRSMYEADVAAYLEDHPRQVASIAERPLRNLGDLQMSTVRKQLERIEAAPKSFSADRWNEYKADARYFRSAMGERAYFQTFYDMGGNATPVWIALTYVIFNQLEASDAAFARTALFDVVLILGAFLAVGLVFGPRTAFLSMVVFGANDFIMYGSNWGGATLRHDWMAYLAFGACALKRGRFALAGVLFALATSMRAFPALALLCLTFPVAWWLIEHVRVHRRLPTRAEWWGEHRPLFVVLAAAALTGALLFLGSSLLLGFEAWGDWYAKVGQLSADPHGNHISLRSLIAGWDADQPLVLADRLLIFLTAVAFYVGLVFAACRGQRYEQAAVLGLVLTPVFFYPANYYIHLVWLLPLVMVEQRKLPGPDSLPFDPAHAQVGLALLALCAAQYFTVLETDRGLHFYLASVLLFAALTFLLVTLARRNATVAVAVAVASSAADPVRDKPRPPANVKRRRRTQADDAAE